MYVRKKSIKSSTNYTGFKNIIKKQIKEVFYKKKVRPRDLTENFGTGSAYPINNYNGFIEV